MPRICSYSLSLSLSFRDLLASRLGLVFWGLALLSIPGTSGAEELPAEAVRPNEYSVILPTENGSKLPTARLPDQQAGRLPDQAGKLEKPAPPQVTLASVSEPAATTSAPLETHAELRGWDHLFNLLVDEGVDAKSLIRVLSDPRMPRQEPLYFSLQPRESHYLYRHHGSVAAQRNALRFYRAHAATFQAAEKAYSVPRALILSLLQVETGCGGNTGNERVFFRLARLATAASAENVQANFLRKKRTTKLLSLEQVGQRAAILESLFLKHVAATFSVAERAELHPLEVRGSGAGAIGMPQFLPGHVKTYGKDGDSDGHIDIFQPADAIYSVANYLHSFGWSSERPMTEAEKRDVIRHYNRSEPYVSTVLGLQANLDRFIRQVDATPPASSAPTNVSVGNAERKCADKDGIKPCA